jgi:hypothetical protein
MKVGKGYHTQTIVIIHLHKLVALHDELSVTASFKILVLQGHVDDVDRFVGEFRPTDGRGVGCPRGTGGAGGGACKGVNITKLHLERM